MPPPAANTNPEQEQMPVRQMSLIGIPSCTRTINERVIHGVADKYPSAVIEPARYFMNPLVQSTTERDIQLLDASTNC